MENLETLNKKDIVICIDKRPICIINMGDNIYNPTKIIKMCEELCKFVCWNFVDCTQCKNGLDGYVIEEYIKNYNKHSFMNDFIYSINPDNLHILKLSELETIYNIYKTYINAPYDIDSHHEDKKIKEIKSQFNLWKEEFLKNNKEYQQKLKEKRLKIEELENEGKRERDHSLILRKYVFENMRHRKIE